MPRVPCATITGRPSVVSILEASRNWILSNAHARTMGLSSCVSSAWLHISSGVSEPCLWHGLGLPLSSQRSHLKCLCQSLWSHRPGGAAAPQVRIAQLEKGGSNAVIAMALLGYLQCKVVSLPCAIPALFFKETFAETDNQG